MSVKNSKWKVTVGRLGNFRRSNGAEGSRGERWECPVSVTACSPYVYVLQERPPTCILIASWACWKGKRPDQEAPSLTLVPTGYWQGTSPSWHHSPCNSPLPAYLPFPLLSSAGRTWSPPRSRTPKVAGPAVWVRENLLGRSRGLDWAGLGLLHPRGLQG